MRMSAVVNEAEVLTSPFLDPSKILRNLKGIFWILKKEKNWPHNILN